MIKLISPKNGATVSTLYGYQAALADGGELCRPNIADASFPAPVRFEFEPCVSATLILTDSHGNSRAYPTQNGHAEIYNLLVNEDYFWSVRIGAMRSESRAFHTCDKLPRMIFVQGLSNVRDIGGYLTTDEKRVRQGLLYRASEADTHENIASEGLLTLTEELSIKTDIDLRGINGELVRAIPSSKIKYFNFPLAAYVEIFTPEQKSTYKEIFNLLADKSIYPAVAHCAAGMDRAGTFLFILGALLGIDEGDLMTDYEMSSFSHWGERSRDSTDFAAFLEKFHCYGKSAKKAAEEFLSECGVSSETVENIRKIFIIE